MRGGGVHCRIMRGVAAAALACLSLSVSSCATSDLRSSITSDPHREWKDWSRGLIAPEREVELVVLAVSNAPNNVFCDDFDKWLTDQVSVWFSCEFNMIQHSRVTGVTVPIVQFIGSAIPKESNGHAGENFISHRRIKPGRYRLGLVEVNGEISKSKFFVIIKFQQIG